MTDLSEYQRMGDLAARFDRTKSVERAQGQVQKLRDYVEDIVAMAPPIPPDARDKIAELLRPHANAPKPTQMRWRFRRYCSEVVEKSADEKHFDSDEASSTQTGARSAGASHRSSWMQSRSGRQQQLGRPCVEADPPA